MTDFNWPLLQEVAPPKTLGFAHATLDRAAHLRSRAEELAALETKPEAKFYAFCGDQVVLAKRGDALDALFDAGELPAADFHRERVFLGIEGDRPRFAQFIDPAIEETLKTEASLVLMGVRQVAVERPVSAADLGAIAEGKALTLWHWKHRFCSNCGAPTVLSQGGWRRDCAACGTQHFPRTDPVVIMLIVDGDRCVLGRQARFVA
ncbi:MAG: NADH pyrophosphatase, partial [Beijerinckiaceae bacterium]|nr:NADH pyrophosphatase [Beijerinckiaceae bacterium]